MGLFIFLFSGLPQTWTSWTKHSQAYFFPLDDASTSIYSLPPAKSACPIFTYFQPLPDLVDPTVIQILDIWGYAFYAQGFRPVILNRTSAAARANFTEILTRFSGFPTVNSAEYDLSCYLRWVALAEQGGGLLMDYDILPMTSSRSVQIREWKECRWGNLTTYRSMTPMVTHGNASEIEKWVRYMLNFKLKDATEIHGKPHMSDMLMALHAIDHNQEVFALKSALPFFHYSHHARHHMLGHIKRPATEIMIRNQHIYHFLHHDIYLPIPESISPYSVQIVRSLTLCPDIITTYDDVDSLCTYNNTFADICKLITVNGFWSANDPETGKCAWKTGRPDSVNQWGILESAAHEREPFVVAVLPQPKTYLWRLWSNENSLPSRNASNRTREFSLWALHHSSCPMLDALIPASADKLNVDNRIIRAINAMRSGQALLMTEKLIAQLHKYGGKEAIEKWISAHVGFFLNIAEPNINWELEPVIDLNSELFSGDDRFYSAVHKENERWTQDWNNWRNTFLPVSAGQPKAS